MIGLDSDNSRVLVLVMDRTDDPSARAIVQTRLVGKEPALQINFKNCGSRVYSEFSNHIPAARRRTGPAILDALGIERHCIKSYSQRI